MQVTVDYEVGLLTRKIKACHTERNEIEIRLHDRLIKDTFQLFLAVAESKQTLLTPPFDAVFTFCKT